MYQLRLRPFLQPADMTNELLGLLLQVRTSCIRTTKTLVKLSYAPDPPCKVRIPDRHLISVDVSISRLTWKTPNLWGTGHGNDDRTLVVAQDVRARLGQAAEVVLARTIVG